MDKRKVVIITFAMIVSLFSGTQMFMVDVEAADIFFNDDWIVSSDESYNNKSILLSADLLVKEGNSLALSGCELEITSQKDEIRTLTVEDGGRLSILGGTLVTSSSDRYGYRIIVNGEIEVHSSTIEGLEGESSKNYFGGIRVSNGEADIKDSSITNAALTGISFHSSSGTLSGSTIKDSGWNGIYCYDSDSVSITDCTIENNRNHGISVSTSNPTIDNCVVSQNKGSGIYIKDGSPVITGCTIEDNDEMGIKSLRSSASVKDTVLELNGQWGLEALEGEPSMEDITFGIGDMANSLGDMYLGWPVNVRILAEDGDPVEGANLWAISKTGDVGGKWKAGVHGDVNISYLREYEIIDGEKVLHSPYSFISFKIIGGENWTWEGERSIDDVSEFEVVLKADKEEGEDDDGSDLRVIIGLPLLLIGVVLVYGLMRLKTNWELKKKE